VVPLDCVDLAIKCVYVHAGVCLSNFLNGLTAARAFAVLHIATIKLRQVYLRAATEIQVVAERSCALIATIAEDSQLVQVVLSTELQSLRSLWP
jgi:hypothetical protein